MCIKELRKMKFTNYVSKLITDLLITDYVFSVHAHVPQEIRRPFLIRSYLGLLRTLNKMAVV